MQATTIGTAPAPAIDPIEHDWREYNAREVTADRLTERERRFIRVATASVAILVFSMKIAPIMNIELGTFVVLPFALWALAEGYARVSPLRLFGYLAVHAMAVGITMAAYGADSFSATAMFYLVVLHAPFVLIADVRRIAYLKLLKNFQWIAIAIATMVFFQWAQQAAGHKMISMEDYVPQRFLFNNYNYIQKINFFSRWYKPNAFFMLETSHTSQLIAIGLMIELCFLRRLTVVLYLAVGLVMTFGGTGTLMTILTLPLILRFLSKRTLIAAAIASPIALLVAAKLGFVENALGRTQEFDKTGTSGSGRFVAPFQIMHDQLLGMPGTVFYGIGAGNMSPYQHQATDMMNPLSKLTIEYGLPVAIAWLIWFHACVFSSRVPLVIAFMVLLQYDMTGGGLLVPIQTYYCLFLCAMIVPARRTEFATTRPRMPTLRLRHRATAAAA